MPVLTKDDFKILRKHGLTELDVYHLECGEKIEEAKRSAKDNDQLLMLCCNLRNRCRLGHLLKTRSGHCIRCKPDALAFQLRHSRPGFVYFAVSISAGLVKVGITSIEDLSIRERFLNQHEYAGEHDWVIVYGSKKFIEVGRIEDVLKSTFRENLARGRRDNRGYESTEAFEIKFVDFFMIARKRLLQCGIDPDEVFLVSLSI